MKYLLGSTALLSTLVLAGQPGSAEASTTEASSQNNQAAHVIDPGFVQPTNDELKEGYLAENDHGFVQPTNDEIYQAYTPENDHGFVQPTNDELKKGYLAENDRGFVQPTKDEMKQDYSPANDRGFVQPTKADMAMGMNKSQGQKVLPATGETASATPAIIGGVLFALGSGLLLLKRRTTK